MPSPTRILLSLALFWSIARPAFAVPQPADIDYINITPNNPDIVLGDEYSDWAYSVEFAKRFKLDKSKVEQMSPGLMAVEFRAEASKNKGVSHTCFFNLYIENGLPIEYPEARSAGYRKDIEHINKSVLTNNKDFTSDYISDHGYYLGLAYSRQSPPFNLNLDVRGTIKINSYRKNALTNISYISLHISNCEEIPPPPYKLHFLFRKKGNTNPKPLLHISDFIKSELPVNLHQRICPYIEKIAYLSFDKLLKNSPNILNLYKTTNQKENTYPLGCK